MEMVYTAFKKNGEVVELPPVTECEGGKYWHAVQAYARQGGDPTLFDRIAVSMEIDEDTWCAHQTVWDYHKGVLYYLNAYTAYDVYGGPEEGGWYYRAGHPIAAVPVVVLSRPDQDLNERYEDKIRALRRKLELYHDNVEIYIELDWPRPFPDRKPHYE